MPFSKNDPNINRKGRPPKEWTMSSLIEEALEEVEEKSGKSFKSLVAKRLAHMAVGGDIQAIKEINNRMDGMAQQQVDVTTLGKAIPTPILAGLDYGVHSDHSDQKDRQADEES